ncbi:MAG: ornithine cyclodeaminase family protein [Paracoccaceae bacterium]
MNKPQILDAKAVANLLPQLDVKSELIALFRALSDGNAVQPAQSITDFPGGGGDFITYLGAIKDAGVFGAKLSPYIVTDTAPVITAWTALMSMQTGQPLVWCDAGLLTTERTAGTTALAVDLLAPISARRLAIIGSGPVALAHLRHVAGLRDWQEIQVYSPNLSDERATLWRQADPRIIIAATARDCLAGSDVVMLCTSSGTPVIDPADTGKPSLFTSISTNAPNAHEVPPAFLCAAQVYCDYLPTTPDSAAEMRLATQDHGWSKDRIQGDLAGLVCGTCATPQGDAPVYFRSIGLGLEDIAMAHGVWKLAQAKNEGETS